MRIEICQVDNTGHGGRLASWDAPVPPRKGEIVLLEGGKTPVQVESVQWSQVQGKVMATIVVVPYYG